MNPSIPNFQRNFLFEIILAYGLDTAFPAVQKMRQQGDLVSFKMGSQNNVLCSHPSHAKYILSDHVGNFPRETKTYIPIFLQVLKTLLGDALISTEGTLWKTQKQRMNQYFHGEVLKKYETIIDQAIAKLILEIKKLGSSEKPFDLYPFIKKLHLTIMGHILFGEDISDEFEKINKKIHVLNQDFNRRVSPLVLPLWMPTYWNFKYHGAQKYLTNLVRRFYVNKQNMGKNTTDVLSMLMSVRDPSTKAPLSFKQIRNELIALLIAGLETTSSALVWTIYFLVKYPEWIFPLLSEYHFKGPIPSYHEVKNLQKTKMVLQEALRLYPPAWSSTRTNLQIVELNGVKFAKGTNFILSLYHIHRHPEVWKNPDHFDPERFNPANAKHIDDFAYLPFLRGPHTCLGRELAMLELMKTISAILKSFEIKIPKLSKVMPTIGAMIFPKYGLQVKMKARAGALQ